MSVQSQQGDRKQSPTGRLARYAALAVAIALVCAWMFGPGGPACGVEQKARDARFRYREAALAAPNVVIVGIDERSISDSRLGRWEWDRRWHAALVDRLNELGAQAIAFDVIFADSSRAGTDDDKLLARAASTAGNVFFPAYALTTAGSRKTEGKGRLSVEPGMVVGRALLPQVPMVVHPIPELVDVCAGGGVIAGMPDRDGVLRRAFFLLKETRTDEYFPTQPLDVVARTQGWPYSAMRFEPAREIALSPQRRIPTDGRGNATINYLGPAGTVPTLSFVDVIDGRVDPKAIRGKIVLVGLTAPGLQDFYPTPFPGMMMGVEIQAQVMENLLSGGFLREAGSTALVLAIALSLLAALVGGLLRPIMGFGVVLLAVGLYHINGLHQFGSNGLILPVLAPTFATGLTFFAIAVFRLTTEEAGRRRLKTEFGRYAPPQVVARLDTGEMAERSAGTIRPVTSVFSDIRGFTDWSAHADPREVVRVLNSYFEAMTQLAFDLEGTVDNIIGDEMFVTFNVLDDQSDHCERAVNLALNELNALEGLNKRWLAEGVLPEPMRIGIGINTGEGLVGNLGSQVRTQYTVLGQSVNLAARLQAYNKELGTAILTTAEVVAALPQGAFEIRSHGMHEVRGHPVPIEVFEVLGRRVGLSRVPVGEEARATPDAAR